MREKEETYLCPKCHKQKQKWIKDDFTGKLAKTQGICKECFIELFNKQKD